MNHLVESFMEQLPRLGYSIPGRLHGRTCEEYSCLRLLSSGSIWSGTIKQPTCDPFLTCEGTLVSLHLVQQMSIFQVIPNSIALIGVIQMCLTGTLVTLYMCVRRGCFW